MRGASIHRFLEEFDAGGAAEASPPPAPRPRAVERQPEPVPGPDPLQDAYDRGFRQGQQAERSLADAQLAELSVAAEQRVAAVEAAMGERVADLLVHELRHGIARAEATISDRLVDILAPFVGRALADRSLRDLAGDAAHLIAATGALSIELIGPPDLVTRVAAMLAQRGIGVGSAHTIVCTPVEGDAGDGAEVRVAIDDMVIETRLGDWLKRVEEACV